MPSWNQLPKHLHALAAATPGSVLLQTSRFDADNRHSYLFLNPIQTISAQSLGEIPDLFRRIELALAQGHHVAGYLSYECGYHFERFEEPPLSSQLPLAWFGVYLHPFIFDHARGSFESRGPNLSAVPSPRTIPNSFAANAQLTITEDEYSAKIERIKNYIEAGDTYQVNFTDSVTAHTPLSPAQAFAALSASQPVSYSALLNLATRHILSFSPELFFRITNGEISTRPMKGTMPRGLDLAEDEQQAACLQSDEKNRSEHVMIVDLLRNDLGRICAPGSVRVDGIFSVEHYATLLQMTSTISGTLRPSLSYYDIFRALFPSGSITGAPKIRTMEIIRELESRPRGVYTGAIGHIAPNGSATFNVAIRTLVLEQGVAHMGVGGGIVADSVAASEYRECLLKASFLTRVRHDFQLIETMLCENGSITMLSLHLDRLEASARYFDFIFDRAEAETCIADYTNQLPTNEPHRIRLLLDATGTPTLTHTLLTPDPPTLTVRISTEHTNSSDVFLRHKTTHRALYERELAKARAEGCDEVLFLNERNELTEGAISNLFLQRECKLLTPPLASGVLPGILRRHLLETDPAVEEHILTSYDLDTAEAIFLCNSVRGLRRITTLIR
jgi:para-aminobenzoate synthetase/4-amino-4-deoxychorismate lyase